jgi:hypothetical protein
MHGTDSQDEATIVYVRSVNLYLKKIVLRFLHLTICLHQRGAMDRPSLQQSGEARVRSMVRGSGGPYSPHEFPIAGVEAPKQRSNTVKALYVSPPGAQCTPFIRNTEHRESIQRPWNGVAAWLRAYHTRDWDIMRIIWSPTLPRTSDRTFKLRRLPQTWPMSCFVQATKHQGLR